jgi:hypothetical protein
MVKDYWTYTRVKRGAEEGKGEGGQKKELLYSTGYVCTGLFCTYVCIMCIMLCVGWAWINGFTLLLWLQIVFGQILQRQKWILDTHKDTIVRNADELLRFHTRLLLALEQACQSKDIRSRCGHIATVFLDMVSMKNNNRNRMV